MRRSVPSRRRIISLLVVWLGLMVFWGILLLGLGIVFSESSNWG